MGSQGYNTQAYQSQTAHKKELFSQRESKVGHGTQKITTDSSQRMFGNKYSSQSTFKKSRNSAADNMISAGKRTSSPKNQFMGLSKDGKLSQKLGPISATAKKTSAGGHIPVTDVSSTNYKKYNTNKTINTSSTRVRGGLHQEPQTMKKVQQNSPTSHLENVDLDDYDEETDEFAGYSGSQY